MKELLWQNTKMLPEHLLTSFGLSEKAVRVYLALLERGASSIRQVAEAAQINRQTTHELLRTLIDQGLVAYYKDHAREAYVALEPDVLVSLADAHVERLIHTREELKKGIDDLRARTGKAKLMATVRFYQFQKGVRTILEDVLLVMKLEKKKLYRIYSNDVLSPILHEVYPQFTKERIAAGIRVRALGIGGQGMVQGLDERRQLSTTLSAPTYILIYGNKVAMISMDEYHRPRGVIMEDAAVTETHRHIFDLQWETLKD